MIFFADRDAHDRLEPYLDGTLPPDERAAFERALETDRALADAVALQRSMDDALRRRFGPPDEARVRALLDDAAAAPAPRLRIVARHPWLAGIAAAAMILVGGGLLAHSLGLRPAPRPQSLVAYYDAQSAADMEPQVVCRDDEEFADWFRYQFGAPLHLRATPPDLEVLGLTYAHTLGPDTIHVLARTKGLPVVLYIDREGGAWDVPLAARPGLYLHRARIGPLAVLELSPAPEPVLLPYLGGDRSESSP